MLFREHLQFHFLVIRHNKATTSIVNLIGMKRKHLIFCRKQMGLYELSTSKNIANWCINRYLQTTSSSVSVLKKKISGEIGRFPYIPVAMFSSYFGTTL